MKLTLHLITQVQRVERKRIVFLHRLGEIKNKQEKQKAPLI